MESRHSPSSSSDVSFIVPTISTLAMQMLQTVLSKQITDCVLYLQVEEDEHEAGPGRVLKRPRYSPMPGPAAAAGAQLGQDEPSSSHCSDPAGEQQQLDSCSWFIPLLVSWTRGHPAGDRVPAAGAAGGARGGAAAAAGPGRDLPPGAAGDGGHTRAVIIRSVFSPPDTCIQVMCPVCLSIPRQPPVPCCQNGHVICAKCKERVEVVSLQTSLTPNYIDHNHVSRARCAPRVG